MISQASRIIASLVIATLLFPLRAAAAEDINGTWSFISLYNGSPYNYDMTFSETNGVITGTGGNGQWEITGTISGNQVSWHEDYVGSSYYADRVGTISGDTMEGTWSNDSQNGSWTATRTSGGGGGGGGGGGDGGDGGGGTKRKTAIQLFCNRTGVNLETAECNVTVADKGASPLTVPTGTISFAATDGFSPETSSCNLVELSTYSAGGIASCQGQFSVPAGFPISTKFPISASYPGDTTFEGSATAHELIFVSCIGTPTKPCSGNVGITFADIPRIIENALKVTYVCEGKTTTAKRGAPQVAAQIRRDPASCAINGGISIELATLVISTINGRDDIEGFKAFCRSILPSQAAKDPLLRNLKLAATASDDYLRGALATQAGLVNLIDNGPPGTQKPKPRLAARAKKTSIGVVIGTVKSTLKKNTQKTSRIKINARGKRILEVFKNYGTKEVSVSLKAKATPPSSSKPKTVSAIFAALLN